MIEVMTVVVSVCFVIGAVSLCSIADSLNDIARKIMLHESGWAKGYERGYSAAKRHLGISEDGDT